MALLRIPDGDGHGIDVVDIGGYRVCTFGQPAEVTATRFRQIKNFPCNEEDVFICAPMKSGTHWVWEMVYMLLNGRDETIPKSKSRNMLEFASHEELVQLPAPRVLNSHVNYKHLPDQMMEKRCKIIYVLRNPKDMLVSCYHHVKGIHFYNYDGKWDHFLQLFLKGELEYGSWFDYVLEMEELMEKNPDLPIHTVYYEDLKENNLEELNRLGDFLGVRNTDNLFEKVSEKCNIRNMRADKTLSPEVHDKVFKDNFTMYRKGEIGDWKNYFTVAQNELFDKVYEERMKTSKLKFRYSYSGESVDTEEDSKV